MEPFQIQCECCGKSVQKKLEPYGVATYNLDESLHEKHFKIWASAVASFTYAPDGYTKENPDDQIGNMTFGELERYMENKINLKLGNYYHGQTDYREKWLSPKLYHLDNVDYYVAGNVDNLSGNIATELKTTWVTAKYKLQKVITKAKTQADVYAWINEDITLIKIKIVNLAKPDLNYEEDYKPEIGHVPEILYKYVVSNRESIKKY